MIRQNLTSVAWCKLFIYENHRMPSSRFRRAIRNCVSTSSGAWIQDADLSYEINEPDAYALEEGLQLKEKHGGEVVVLCAGPARAAQTIREALAKGADRAIHIEEDDLGAFDPLGARACWPPRWVPRSPTWS